jgi:hypothetical protein
MKIQKIKEYYNIWNLQVILLELSQFDQYILLQSAVIQWYSLDTDLYILVCV